MGFPQRAQITISLNGLHTDCLLSRFLCASIACALSHVSCTISGSCVFSNTILSSSDVRVRLAL